eukprot:1870865-Pyramimonas_sp.AAC.1
MMTQAPWAPPRRALPGPPASLAETKVTEAGSKFQIASLCSGDAFKNLQTLISASASATQGAGRAAASKDADPATSGRDSRASH